MFLVQRVFTRSAVAVAFYKPTNEFMNHFKVTYKDAGKVLSNTATFSENNLKMDISTMWSDEAAWNEYLTDPVAIAHLDSRSAYNAMNGINANHTASVA